MKSASFLLALWLALPLTSAWAADGAIATLIEGRVRILRDTTWYTVVPGMGIRQGDVIDAAGAAQVLVELANDDAFYLSGPATVLVASLPVAENKAAGPTELYLVSGWLKFVAKAPKAGARIQLSNAIVSTAEAITVVHASPTTFELFMESGSAKIAQLDANGRPGPVQDVNAGEYWGRSAGQSRIERHAPAQFVAAMPRPLLDPLPAFKARYKTARVTPVAAGEVTFAEAEPWLASPYRKQFVKQFTPRLRDREFRAAVDARIARYPEWDRILHPEKYQPKEPATTQ